MASQFHIAVPHFVPSITYISTKTLCRTSDSGFEDKSGKTGCQADECTCPSFLRLCGELRQRHPISLKPKAAHCSLSAVVFPPRAKARIHYADIFLVADASRQCRHWPGAAIPSQFLCLSPFHISALCDRRSPRLCHKGPPHII
jgi:hypothetical protein